MEGKVDMTQKESSVAEDLCVGVDSTEHAYKYGNYSSHVAHNIKCDLNST